jgi:hypothetical protein
VGLAAAQEGNPTLLFARGNMTVIKIKLPLGPACEKDHKGTIDHKTGPDCAKVHGLRIVGMRCSVCDLPWGPGVYSQHERCAFLFDGGEREYAHPIYSLSNGETLEYT